jgi:pimeloyl-ACP methyl ester carboxylesterase
VDWDKCAELSKRSSYYELRRVRWNVVGHDAGSAIAVLYARSFAERVKRLALMSPALFPDLRPYYLFRLLRKPVVGELLAPCVHPLFWRVAMRRACRGKGC